MILLAIYVAILDELTGLTLLAFTTFANNAEQSPVAYIDSVKHVLVALI
jgi:hypothetical protein